MSSSWTEHIQPNPRSSVPKSPPTLSGSLTGFQRVVPDMSGPSLDISDLSALTRVKSWNWPYPVLRSGSKEVDWICLTPDPNISRSITPQRLDSFGGAIKGPPRLSILVSHSFHLANTLRHSLQLQTSLPQDPFRSKLFRRGLSLTLE
jgi:hypothetical protein